MIGARDRLDKRLVHLYERVQTVNFSNVKTVSPNDMWKDMSLLAHTNKVYFQIKYNQEYAGATNS